jgi:DUF971 family protein
MDTPQPVNLHLRKTECLDISWSDGVNSTFTILDLRKNCPCAGCQGERDILGRQLMPILKTVVTGPITAEAAELVGNYALKLRFSDGHDTGIYSFKYLRELHNKLNPQPKRTL